MPRSRSAVLKTSTVVVAAIGYFAVMQTARYGPEIILVPLAATILMPLGEWLDRAYRAYRTVTTFIIYLYIATFFFILGEFSFVDAVLSLVMFIQVYLMVHEKRPRHYGYIALMGFFLLFAAVSESPRPGIAIAISVFMLAVAWMLTALNRFGGQLAVAEAGLPEAAARVQSLDGRRSGRGSSSATRFGLSAIVTTVFAMAAGGLLFAFGPRTEAGVFGANRARVEPTTGVASEVSLLNAGTLASDTTPLMRVQFPDVPNGQYPGEMLWRVTALDRFTGSGWEHDGLVTRVPRNMLAESEIYRFRSDRRGSSLEGLDRVTYTDWPRVRQLIFLDRPPETALPVLQLVKQVRPTEHPEDFSFSWDRAGDFTVTVSTRNDIGFQIEVISEEVRPRPADLRGANTDYGSFMAAEDLQKLTHQNLLPETRALVERVTQSANSPYDKVVALNSYLSGADFFYTTDIPVLPSENAIDAFVLRERRGHCELYASALALMVRSLGIPARVVMGYRDGVWNQGDRSYTVTKDMAHLWAEVYFPGYGWISFDPSPQGQADLPLIDTLSRRIGIFMLRARMIWLRNVVGFRPSERQVVTEGMLAEIFRSGGDAVAQRKIEAGKSALSALGRVVFFVVAPCALAVLLGYWLVRNRPGGPGRRRIVLTDDQQRAVRLRQALVQTFRKWGIACEGRTAEELAVAVAALRTNDPEGAQAIVAAYNATRFGLRPMSGEEFSFWRRRLRSVYLVREGT